MRISPMPRRAPNSISRIGPSLNVSLQKGPYLLLIARMSEQILMPGLWDHPEVLRLTGRSKEPVSIFGPGAVVPLAADDEYRAWQLADILGRFYLVDGKLEPPFCKRDHQTSAETTGH